MICQDVDGQPLVVTDRVEIVVGGTAYLGCVGTIVGISEDRYFVLNLDNGIHGHHKHPFNLRRLYPEYLVMDIGL